MKTKTCEQCEIPLNWTAARRQYGRAAAEGVPEEHLKARYLCQKCTTVLLKEFHTGDAYAFKFRPSLEAGLD